jgi:hypothetical protein
MPSNTWFGGVWAVPSACLRSDNTIIIRVKLVVISRIDGSKVKIVIKPRSCKVTEYSVEPEDPSTALSIGNIF